jgi:hypothetical protein
MLLFASNDTDPQNILSDITITQMLETAQENIELDGMMPKEFKICKSPCSH